MWYSAVYMLLTDSTVYRVNWLRAKAAKDRWAEEVELVTAEFLWTVTFFDTKVDAWVELHKANIQHGLSGHACYCARQATLYQRLRDQCQKMMDSSIQMESVQKTNGERQ